MLLNVKDTSKFFDVYKVEIELMHPDTGSQFYTFIIEATAENVEDIKDGTSKSVISYFKKYFRDSYYHDMKITRKYIFDNEVYTKVLYEGSII